MAVTKKLRLPKVPEYAKKAAKSVTLAAIKAITDETEGIKDFVETNQDVLKETYSAVKNYRDTFNKAKDTVIKSSIFKDVELIIRNVKEDFKSGNWNNTDRDYSDDILGMGDIEGEYAVDGDFAWASSDDDDDDFDDTTVRSAYSASNKVSKAISKASYSDRKTMAKNAEAITKAQMASTISIVAAVDRQAGVISSAVGTVYTEVNKISQYLNSALTTHLENSKKFYESQLESMNVLVAMNKEMLEMQRNLYKKADNDNKVSAYENIFGYSGRNFNIKEYAKNVKKNFKNMLDEYGIGSLSMGGSVNPLKIIAQNPVGVVLEFLAGALMPDKTKNAANRFDKVLTGAFTQVFSHINKFADDYDILGTIAKLFGIKTEKKNKIYTDRYNKGPIPFDGITKRAIIDVIPGYLARIEAAITNSESRYYNYERGKWETREYIGKNYKNFERNEVIRQNSSILSSLSPIVSNIKDAKKRKETEDHITNMLLTIYRDGGAFSEKNGYAYYGFTNKSEFDDIIKYLKKEHPDILMETAINAHAARVNTNKFFKDEENRFHSIYRIMEDDSGKYSHSSNSNSGSPNRGGVGILAHSRDDNGNNVFYYLKEILHRMRGWRGRHNSGNATGGASTDTSHSNNKSNGDGGSSAGSSDGDSNSDDPDPAILTFADALEYERKKNENAETVEKKKSFLHDLTLKIFGNNAIGRLFAGISESLARPLDTVTNLLNKASDNIVAMFFGDIYKDKYGNQITDKRGKPVDNIISLLVYKVETTFDKLHDKFDEWWKERKKKLEENEKFKSFKDGLKNTAKDAGDTIKGAFSGAVQSGKDFANDIKNAATNAYGGIVTKRGLTMVSPGEIIIPSSFDKNVQRRQLALEKRDRAIIANAAASGRMKASDLINRIGLHAEGTISADEFEREKPFITETLKALVKDTWAAENKYKTFGAGAAGGGIGAGLGLLTGFNPIIGGLAGAALSLMNTSDSFKTLMLGPGENGNREGGILNKKIIDFFNKYGTDMKNFGIVGGLAGLLTPFGILGGSAIGAGLGFLKNNDFIKSLILGGLDEEGNFEEGLISKKTQKKIGGWLRRFGKGMGIGAAVGGLGGLLFGGPFGLIGNAALGAAGGLALSTTKVHDLIFGKEGDPNSPSLVKAVKNGILEPAKKHIETLFDDLKAFGKKHVLDPLKRFVSPLGQAFKNMARDLTDKIASGFNNIFETRFGIPIHEFLQEKVFKKLTNIVFKILKLPLTLGKGIVGGASHILGGIGDKMRMKQILTGRAGNMSAQERVDFVNSHKGLYRRTKYGTTDKVFKNSKTSIARDKLLAGMSDADLDALIEVSGDINDNIADNNKKLNNKKGAIARSVVKIANTVGPDGLTGYQRNGTHVYDKAIKLIQTNNVKGLTRFLSQNSKLSQEEKDKIMQIGARNSKMDSMIRSKRSDPASRLSNVLGGKYKSLASTNNLSRLLADEKKARERLANSSKDSKSSATTAKAPPSEPVDAIIEQTDQEKKIGGKIIELLGKISFYTSKGKYKADVSEYVAATAAEKAPGADSKEETEIEESVEREDEREEEKVSWFKATFQGLFGKVKGFKENHKDSKVAKAIGKATEGAKGLLGKIGNVMEGIGSTIFGRGLFKVLKFGAIGAVGISLFGSQITNFFLKAKDFMSETVMPKLKDVLFGEKTSEGVRQGGILAPVREWFENQGGFQGLALKGIETVINNWKSVSENIIGPALSMLIKHFPDLIAGVGIAIYTALKNLRNNTGEDAAEVIRDSVNRSFIYNAAGVASGSNVVGKAMEKVSTKGVGKGMTKLTTKVGGVAVKTTGYGINKAASVGESIHAVADGGVNAIDDLGRTAAGRAAAEAAKNSADDVVKAGIKATAKNAKTKLGEKITAGFVKVFKAIGNSKIGAKLLKFCSKNTTKAVLDAALEKIAKKVGQKVMTSCVGKALTKIASKVAGFSPLAIAIWVMDFVKGMDDAEAIFGVQKNDPNFNVNFGWRCVAGLLNLLTNQFTLGLLPADIIVDIFVEFLFPMFGLDMSGIKQARQNATDAMNAWNEAHPDDQYDNLNDFNKKDRFDTKLKRKFKNWTKNLFKKDKDTAAHTASSEIYESASYAANNESGGSKYLYQSHPAIANMRYGVNSRIYKTGCAPVAAYNAVNNIYNDSMGIEDAIHEAKIGNYIDRKGNTNINYFADVFSKRGIPVYKTRNKNLVLQSLKSGNQVIMLGNDGNIVGGAFGNRNHFITGIAADKNGKNIIVQDPASPNKYSSYGSNILNGMKTAIITNPANNVGGYGLRTNNGGSSINRSGLDYQAFLETIITILISISNNTALLSKVLELLSERFDIHGDTKSIQNAINSNSEATKKAITSLLSRSGNSNNLINRKNNEHILEAMTALAKE